MFNKTFLFPGTDRKTDKNTYNNDSYSPRIVVIQKGRNAKMQTNTISKSQQNKQQT